MNLVVANFEVYSIIPSYNMPASRIARKTKTAVRTKSASAKPESRKNGLLDYFRFGESYTSLILGIVVVIIASIILLSFAKNTNIVGRAKPTPKQETSSTKIEPTKTEAQANQITPKGAYRVQAGDSLWTIAEEHYNDGYKWTAIASENKLSNPGLIEVGTVLSLPKVETSQRTTVQQMNKITGNTYTVVRGDYLWEIAIRAYGDGYQWVKIARANKLANPDIIHSGNKLVIPR